MAAAGVLGDGSREPTGKSAYPTLAVVGAPAEAWLSPILTAAHHWPFMMGLRDRIPSCKTHLRLAVFRLSTDVAARTGTLG